MTSPYTITERLRHGHGAEVYRAIRSADGRPVVLKVLDPRGRSKKDLEQLRREYEIESFLDTPAVVKPLGLDTYQGMTALVTEDFGGRSLDTLLGAPMAVEPFLALAVRLAAALAEVHQRGVVHKDLKPHNILFNTATGEVKIADFGLSSRLAHERGPAAHTRLIEGSLPYLSPEQTGRTSRDVDTRADLYALGVTFYEMITGRLPFEAKDPVEWVHCHVARTPSSPAEVVPGVPEILGRIVLKLLAKMPEDRYQTARGLRLDLERCLAAWQRSAAIAPFALGSEDAADRLEIPRRLYGREAEIALLREAFGRVLATGASEILLVSGDAGIGKSALVRELYKPVVREGGFFVSGKFDQYLRDIPYATLVQALRELVLRILAGSEEDIAAWRERLLGALGINGQIIVDVIREVELVIGPQPPAPELPSIEACNRFRMVFRKLLGVFARAEHPLALFLDDLQWADPASLELLEELLIHPEVRNLLLIGAYRDDEESASHALAETLAEVRKAGALISDIVLGPIPSEHLTAFVAEALRCRAEDVAALAELVGEKTAYNPFFAIQFLLSLREEHLIEHDPRAGIFRWDVARIRAKGFTDNVVDLMVGALLRLPAAAQEALEQLACLGSTADVAILSLVRGGTASDVHADLRDAVRAGLVLQQGDAYRFLHDRVQEAAYSLIPEGERAAVHLRIGKLLSSRLSEDEIAARIFDVANQWNRGAHLLTELGEKESLRRLDVLAGTRAKAAIAYASARDYLAQAAALLPEGAWSTDYEETLALHLSLSECEYLVGHYREADALLDVILRNARERRDRALAYRLRMRMDQVAGRYAAAVAAAVDALGLFGVTFPETEGAVEEATRAELGSIQERLRGRHIADLVDAKVVSDPDERAIISLMAESLPALYNGWPSIFPLLTLEAVSFSLQHGNTGDSCVAYAHFAMLLASVFADIPSAFAFSEMMLRLNEKFDDRRLRGMLLVIHADQINFWQRPFTTDFPFLERGFLACLEVGDLLFAGLHGFATVWQMVERGDPLDDVWCASQRFAAFAKQSHNHAIWNTIQLEQQFVACLKGRTRSPTSFDDDAFDEAACAAAIRGAPFNSGVILYHVMKQIAAFLDSRYAEALEHAAQAAALLGPGVAQPVLATYHFFRALTLAALAAPAPALDEELQKLETWARACPENFENRHELVSAEIARVDGRELDAERHYEQAIRSARENGFVHHEALAYELASRFYRARGLDEIADTYLRDARASYARWGADGKVAQIDRQHPGLVEERTALPAATVAVQAEQLDLLSVTKASQTISSEIVLESLARTLLELVLEQGGAQRACLVLLRDRNLAIEAEATQEASGAATTSLGAVSVDASPSVPASLLHYVQRTKERVILGDASDDAGKFAGDPYFARKKPRSVLAMPILRQAEVVGLLYLENNLLAGAFTPDRLAALELLATQAAISLENALLVARERAARAAAEDAERRAAFLAEAGALLSESLDDEETLARLGRLCVRSLADHCFIDLVVCRGIQRIAVAHADPAKDSMLHALQRRYPPRWGSPHPAAVVLRTGAPVLMPELPDDVLRTYCEDDEHLRLLLELGTRSGLAVPLVARGQMLGALTLSAGASGRRYGPADVELAQEIARRAAIAIDNARLYRARSEFLSIASHELHTPVTSLMLAVQSLRRSARAGRPVDPQVLDRMLEIVSRQGDRLTRLTGDLLDVAGMESGHLPLELVDVDLGALVRQAVAHLAADLAQSRCSVRLEDGSHVVGRWDRARLDRAVTNLLSNAIKFGPDAPIEITVRAERGMARLTVRDHGIGIEPDELDRIFGRFERAVSERYYGGLGLGLYSTRRIVEAHGGSIRCESRRGAGATFTVELPCEPPASA